MYTFNGCSYITDTPNSGHLCLIDIWLFTPADLPMYLMPSNSEHLLTQDNGQENLHELIGAHCNKPLIPNKGHGMASDSWLSITVTGLIKTLLHMLEISGSSPGGDPDFFFLFNF